MLELDTQLTAAAAEAKAAVLKSPSHQAPSTTHSDGMDSLNCPSQWLQVKSLHKVFFWRWHPSGHMEELQLKTACEEERSWILGYANEESCVGVAICQDTFLCIYFHKPRPLNAAQTTADW